MRTHRHTLNKTINSFFSLRNVRSSCSVKESGGVCSLCTTSKQQEATAALSWKELRTGTVLLSFSTSFFTSQTGSCPTFLKYLCTLGLLVFYLGFHIIYLHCLLNGWAQRACILCWRDEKDPGQRPARTQANKKKTTFCSQMLRARQWGSFRPTNLVTLYNI